MGENISKSIAASVPIIFLGTLFGRGLALIGEVIIARELQPETFGAIALIYTICLSLGGVLTMGINDGITRELSSRVDDQDEIIGSALFITATTASIGVVILYAISGSIQELLSINSLDTYLPYFLPFLLAYPIRSVLIGILRAEGKSFETVLSQDLAPKIVGLSIFGTMVIFGHAVWGAVAYWALPPIVVIIIAIPAIGWKSLWNLEPSLQEIRRLFRFSWPLAFSSIIFLIMSNADILMIGYFLTEQQVGFYRAIQPLQQVTMLVLISFTFLFFPLATTYFEEKRLKELNRLYGTVSKWIAILTFPPVLLFVAFPQGIIQTLYGTQYLPAADALSVLLGGLYIRAFVGPNGDLAKAVNHSEIELTTSSLGVITNLIVNFILIPQYGIVGAAVGTAAGFGVYTLSETAVLFYYTSVHPFRINTLKPLIAAAAATMIFSQFYVIRGFASLIVVLILICIVQVIVIPLTDSLTSDDITLLRKFTDIIGISIPKSVLQLIEKME